MFVLLELWTTISSLGGNTGINHVWDKISYVLVVYGALRVDALWKSWKNLYSFQNFLKLSIIPQSWEKNTQFENILVTIQIFWCFFQCGKCPYKSSADDFYNHFPYYVNIMCLMQDYLNAFKWYCIIYVGLSLILDIDLVNIIYLYEKYKQYNKYTL